MPVPGGDGSRLVRRVIDSDNSCLFNAVGYVVERTRSRARELRKVGVCMACAGAQGWSAHAAGRGVSRAPACAGRSAAYGTTTEHELVPAGGLSGGRGASEGAGWSCVRARWTRVRDDASTSAGGLWLRVRQPHQQGTRPLLQRTAVRLSAQHQLVCIRNRCRGD